VVNFIFLFLGIIFHQTPRRFLDSVTSAVKNAGGIIVQFPFYAGIMGMMVASGLSEQMSLWFVSISNDFTLPWFTFISAGIVNFFVPSGGGQWAIQGPIMIPAALEIGVDTAKTAVVVAWGDAWTNMIQPFWALPLLAIAGLKVKALMGFGVTVSLWRFLPISIGLLFFCGTYWQVACTRLIYNAEFDTRTVFLSPRTFILLVSVSRSILLYLLFLHLNSYIVLSINHHIELMRDLLDISMLLHRHSRP